MYIPKINNGRVSCVTKGDATKGPLDYRMLFRHDGQALMLLLHEVVAELSFIMKEVVIKDAFKINSIKGGGSLSLDYYDEKVYSVAYFAR